MMSIMIESCFLDVVVSVDSWRMMVLVALPPGSVNKVGEYTE